LKEKEREREKANIQIFRTFSRQKRKNGGEEKKRNKHVNHRKETNSRGIENNSQTGRKTNEREETENRRE